MPGCFPCDLPSVCGWDSGAWLPSYHGRTAGVRAPDLQVGWGTVAPESPWRLLLCKWTSWHAVVQFSPLQSEGELAGPCLRLLRWSVCLGSLCAPPVSLCALGSVCEPEALRLGLGCCRLALHPALRGSCLPVLCPVLRCPMWVRRSACVRAVVVSERQPDVVSLLHSGTVCHLPDAAVVPPLAWLPCGYLRAL